MSRRVIRRSLLHAPGGRMAHQSRVARWVSSTATLALLTTQAAVGQAPSRAAVAAPPVAPIRAVTDDYYGTTVVDPYRYRRPAEPVSASMAQGAERLHS